MDYQLPPICQPDQALLADIQHIIDQKTKPLNALGQLEKMAAKLALIQQSTQPVCRPAKHIVFAADHGITAEGVSPFPSEVTQQMVLNFVQGGAAINVFCQLHQVQLAVVDVGVKLPFAADLPIVHAKIAAGTANFAQQAAMSEAQLSQAMSIGQAQVQTAIAQGIKLLSFGEMGIGNTTPSAAIMAVVTGLAAPLCVGAGTGSNAQQIALKAQVIDAAIKLHQLDAHSDGLTILRCVGGFEIAAMCAAMLQAAAQQTAFLVDGFIATAALLIAQKINANVLHYAFFAHQSNESGHGAMLHFLQQTPLLRLNMALGEGTGAVLAVPLLDASCAFVANMASFASAGVSEAL